MKVLVVIPARGGSKGVLKKNIKILGDKPLIAHAIECAQKSKSASKIIVSTDSEEIAAVAKLQGCDTIMRPEELSTDTSNVVSAVEHVYQELNQVFDIIVLLQPTAPLRTAEDLDTIVSMFENEEIIDGVISVIPMDDMHPARMYNLLSNDEMVPFLNDGETSRRQDLNPVYYRNGCFYAVRTPAFFREKSFMVQHKKGYVMNAEWLANIDTPRDFKIAEILYQDWKNESFNN
jgi:CMP-N,N'-diacetyllegionaminic acid synthase